MQIQPPKPEHQPVALASDEGPLPSSEELAAPPALASSYIIGSDDSHDTLRQVLQSRQPCKVLDAPTGKGPLAAYLLQAGWDVHCADIDRAHFTLKGIPFTQVNLNRALPFENESFDAVVCANGLHRLFNPRAAITEFYRILRPGGRLYLNINNYSSIDRRLQFLFFGSIERALNEGVCQQSTDEPEAHVRVCLLYPQVANLLNQAGFTTVSVQPAAVRLRHRLLTPVAWLLRPAKYLVSSARRGRDHMGATSSNAICPGGRYLFIEALKSK